MMRILPTMMASIGLIFASAPIAAPTKAQRALDRETMQNLNCTLRLTNDYVTDTIMMQDIAASSAECKAICARFASNSVVSMKDEVKVLRYSCDYRGRIVEKRSLK